MPILQTQRSLIFHKFLQPPHVVFTQYFKENTLFGLILFRIGSSVLSCWVHARSWSLSQISTRWSQLDLGRKWILHLWKLHGNQFGTIPKLQDWESLKETSRWHALVDTEEKQKSSILNHEQIKWGYFDYWTQRCGQPWICKSLSQGDYMFPPDETIPSRANLAFCGCVYTHTHKN